MDRNRQIAIVVGIALVAFLLGFVPQWMRANRAGEDRDAARFELRMAQTEGKIGAALTESLRSNYERARQLMTEVFDELQTSAPRLQGTQRREVDAILSGRDEIITLLARAAPESSQRLMLLYTRYHTAFNAQAPAAATTTPAK
ncbi:hypothetical protein [Longimicrobium sp.]|uniref:hypothetical protein n=1 Tax=Longimicrobium sp. TaxID=2029185 RepID=UPI002E311EAD|nr:hypothetical protein [Longimicrobium sp.]HEX6041139.1 hypothetical protein [Longimicrobium sp.]